jgi:DNA-binding response OmpR family regulator
MSETVHADAGSSLLTRHASPEIYDDGHLRVEHGNYYASLGGRQLRLPRKEFLILSRLARNAGRVVTSEEIWRHAWGDRAPFNAESLHVHIYRLRRRLAASGPRIETMVNVGYKLVPASRENGAHAGVQLL